MTVSFPWRAPALFLLLTLAAGCGQGPAAAPKPAPAPAPVAEKPRAEGELARTTLTDRAVRSLKVRTATASTRPVQEQLRLPGWVMVPQGREVTLTAPLSGYVRAASRGVPLPGLPVKEGQLLFRIEPVLSPLEGIQLATLKRGVENELAKAREGVSVAQKELTRLTVLHKQKLRAQQDIEQARARLENAREDLTAARDKIAMFGKAADGSATLPPVPVRAPLAGTVLAVPVSPGQYVTATAPLTTVANMTRLWLRVPVPEADLPRIRGAGSAEVLLPRGVRLAVRPVALVPQVDPTRHTADLIYELPASARKHGLVAKDQMVNVGVPLEARRKETVVPYAAVVFDAQAGAWIYLDRTPAGAKKHIYERRRVQLGPALGDDVVIRTPAGTPPCQPDDKVVVAGAGELFSREFHWPEKPVPGDED
jgi:cobalt-zinc-cadmium efflux system membrane fusion protein